LGGRKGGGLCLIGFERAKSTGNKRAWTGGGRPLAAGPAKKDLTISGGAIGSWKVWDLGTQENGQGRISEGGLGFCRERKMSDEFGDLKRGGK